MTTPTPAQQLLVDLKPVFDRCRERLATLDPELLAGLAALDVLEDLVELHNSCFGFVDTDEEHEALARIVRRAADIRNEAYPQ
jgi:hypothetical protein